MESFIITMLQDGGYVVSTCRTDRFGPDPMLFAATKIDTALEYVKNKLNQKAMK